MSKRHFVASSWGRGGRRIVGSVFIVVASTASATPLVAADLRTKPAGVLRAPTPSGSQIFELRPAEPLRKGAVVEGTKPATVPSPRDALEPPSGIVVEKPKPQGVVTDPASGLFERRHAVEAAILRPPPPPTRLKVTVDPQVCTDHSEGDAFGFAGMECKKNTVDRGGLNLVWSWQGSKAFPKADAFRIYRLALAKTGIRDTTVAFTVNPTAKADPKQGAVLFATQDRAGRTYVALPKPPDGFDGKCFAVAAVVGGAESDLSNSFCSKPDRCELDPGVEKRKKDFQIWASGDKDRTPLWIGDNQALAFLATKNFPWGSALAPALQTTSGLREAPVWTDERIRQWWRQVLNLDPPSTTQCCNPDRAQGNQSAISKICCDPRRDAKSAVRGECCEVDPLVHLENNADFSANTRIRVLYLHASHPELPGVIRDELERSLLAFRYGLDEELGGKANEVGRMNLWSENHQILIAATEYLAGQYFENRDRSRLFEVTFRKSLEYARAGTEAKSSAFGAAPAPSKTLRGAVTSSAASAATALPKKKVAPAEATVTRFDDGLTGKQHMARARKRLLAWFDERFRFGFSEFNAPGYYDEHMPALLNLADFADDPEVRTRAAAVLDLLVFDLARFTQNGSFGVAAGRAHGKHKLSGWKQSIGDAVEILFGTRKKFNADNSLAANALASSERYCVPKALLAIGRHVPERYVERARLSLDFDEGPDHGIGMTSLADALSWWARGALVTTKTVELTCRIANHYKLWGADPFDAEYFIGLGMKDLCGLPARRIADELSPALEGIALTRANLHVFRNREVMLSSIQNYRVGQTGHQTNPWQATFDMDATVFTSFPAAKQGGDAVSWWNGNVVGPGVIQHENAAIIGYSMPIGGIHWIMHGDRTHAWFPAYAFDEVDERRPEGCDCKFEADRIPRKAKTGALVGAAIGFATGGVPGAVAGAAGGSSLAAIDGLGGALKDALEGKCACTRGKWFFGRKRQGYIGLYAAQENCTWGVDHDKLSVEAARLAKDLGGRSGDSRNEIRCEDHKRNVFIAVVGDRAEYGSFDNFKWVVARGRIKLSGLNWEPMDLYCGYDVPARSGTSRHLALNLNQKEGYLNGARLDPRELYDNRFHGPFAEEALGEKAYQITFGGLKLTLDASDRNRWLRHGSGLPR